MLCGGSYMTCMSLLSICCAQVQSWKKTLISKVCLGTISGWKVGSNPKKFLVLGCLRLESGLDLCQLKHFSYFSQPVPNASFAPC